MSLTRHIPIAPAGPFAVATLSLAAALAILSTPAAAAPVLPVNGSHEEPLFTWRGTVDREVVLVLDGRRLVTQGLDARLPSTSRVSGAIPRRDDGIVRVVLENGRGNVDVIERPTSRNNYRTVVRIRDPLGGSDRYQVAAFWVTNDGNGNVDRDNSRGNSRDNNRGNDRSDRRGGNDGWGNDSRNDGRDSGRNDDGRNGGSVRSGPGVLRWSGRVDADVDVILQGNQVSFRTLSGATTTRVRSTISGGALPRQDGGVSIVNGNGRGRVYVIQQPSRYNGYTAVIRISDPRSGAADYEFAARW